MRTPTEHESGKMTYWSLTAVDCWGAEVELAYTVTDSDFPWVLTVDEMEGLKSDGVQTFKSLDNIRAFHRLLGEAIGRAELLVPEGVGTRCTSERGNGLPRVARCLSTTFTR